MPFPYFCYHLTIYIVDNKLRLKTNINMDYLKLFQNHSEYEAFVSGGTMVRPNVSHCVSENEVHYNPIPSPKDIVGSVAYYDGSTVKFALKDDYTSTMGTPIGVVVIPKSHMDDGKCRVMSLANMSYKTPETGTLVGTSNSDAQIAGANLMWGVYNNDIAELTNYDKVVTVDGATTADYGYLPSDWWVGKSEVVIPDDNTYTFTPINNQVDTETAWYGSDTDENWETLTDSNMCPSPYLADGSKNPLYFTEGQALCDMDGKSNTNILVNLSAIKTQTSGEFSNVQANYPAAMACHMYHTSGTQQGDWYLPAMGELGYLYVRAKKINETLASLGSSAAVGYGVPTDWNVLGSWLWSSSEFSGDRSRSLSNDGTVFDDNKFFTNYDYRVRAFAAF